MNTKTNSKGHVIKVGQEVKLIGAASRSHTCPKGRENNKTAEVWSIGSEGELHLSRDLKGCRYWNVDDVLPSKARDRRVPVAVPGFVVTRSEAERLLRWVNHDNSCSVRPGDWESTKCTCGLNKTLKEFKLV